MMRNYLVLLFFISFGVSNTNSNDFPSIDDMEGIAEEFIKDLKETLKRFSNYEEINEKLSGIHFRKTTINAEELNNEFVKGIERIFKSKTEILKSIQSKAQAPKKENTEINKDFTYLNMRDIDQMADETKNQYIKIYPPFSKTIPVNTTDSFVQVPTNIYSQKKEVLDVVRRTKDLDETFSRNFNAGKSLYQFFGDATGIFRIFPGNVIGVKKKDGYGADLFDCRRRAWYIQAAASAKDIVIVIDMSGSMIGNNIGIAKIASASLIDTLQENDFFNVITVNNEVKYVHDNVQCLIQATKENKEMIKRALQKITEPVNVVDVDKGMKKAFEILNEDNDNNCTIKQKSNCNKAIMFITDGIEGEYAGKTTFESENKDKTVRVFSFLVGRSGSPDKKALVKMSCDNHGHFYTIETLGNVWDTVLDYLNVMSRPFRVAFDEDRVKPSYTSAYLDSSGFGMVMSVSLSVFTQNKEDSKHQSLLGVAGTDISLQNLMYQLPGSKSSVFNHGFVINNNGFILIHPKFREQTGYLPAPPNILLEDIEYSINENESLNLKEAMLKSMTGSSSFPTKWLYDNNRKILLNETSYQFQHINGTDFIAAVGVLKVDQNILEIDMTNEGENYDTGFSYALNGTIKSNDTHTFVKISPWDYCPSVTANENIRNVVMVYPGARVLYEKLNESKEVRKNCSEEMLQRLLVPAGAIYYETKKWYFEKDTVQTIFAATSGGYLKYMTPSEQIDPFGRDVLKTSIFENAAANNKYDFIATTPERGREKTNESVYVSFMHSAKTKENVLIGVSGASLNSGFINEKLLNATLQKTTICQNNDTALCAILDRNGFIVASNQYNKYTGRFIGEKMGKLVEHWVKENIMERNVVRDTQAECEIRDEELTSGANILLTPAKLIINAAVGLGKSVYWILVKLSIFLVTLMQSFKHTNGQEPRNIRVSCVNKLTFYHFNVEKMENKRFEYCKECSVQYSFHSIANKTNMLFLIVDTPTCLKGCEDPPVNLNPVPIHIPKLNKWSPIPLSFRKNPTSCFNNTKYDTGKEACGAASLVKFSLSLLYLLTLLWSSLLFGWI